MKRALISMMMLSLWPLVAYTQNLSYAEQLDLLESEMDSIGIFMLLDSALATHFALPSEFNVRLSYMGSVTSSGRDFDLEQSGLAMGLAYYDRSGVYADVSGYWNNGTTPSYSPTILAAGYLKNKKRWTYSLDYERWIYNPTDSSENTLTNGLGSAVSYTVKNWSVGLDYSFLFGKSSAHRIYANLGYQVNLGDFWKFKYVGLLPSFNILFGSSELTTMRLTTQQISSERAHHIRRLLSLAEASPAERKAIIRRINNSYQQDELSEAQRNQLIRQVRTAAYLTEEQQDALRQILSTGTYSRQDYYTEEAFGLLNYSFTLPLSLSTNRVSILFSYTYNIPVQLPNEIYTVESSGYFSASLLYRIPLK